MATLRCRKCNKPFSGKTVAEAYDKVARHWKRSHPESPIFRVDRR